MVRSYAPTDGKWIAIALMNRPVAALSQSFLRTKAHNYTEFLKIAELKANSSNNTIFADDEGDIAYLHPSFIPRRDDRFDFTKPVDGADPATDWKGLHALDEAPHVLNPPSGWIFNTNNWPYSAAGADSPRRTDYPRYMDTAGENPRGVHAIGLLNGRKDFTLQRLQAAAYDSYLPAFARLIPTLASAFDRLPANSPLRDTLSEPIELLRSWDDRWSSNSVATAVAVFWGEALWATAAEDPDSEQMSIYDRMATRVSDEARLTALAAACKRLSEDFGTWRTPWGQINRFQRLNDDIAPHFTDSGESSCCAVHLITVGIARLLRRETIRRQQAALRHERQQFCRRR